MRTGVADEKERRTPHRCARCKQRVANSEYPSTPPMISLSSSLVISPPPSSVSLSTLIRSVARLERLARSQRGVEQARPPPAVHLHPPPWPSLLAQSLRRDPCARRPSPQRHPARARPPRPAARRCGVARPLSGRSPKGAGRGGQGRLALGAKGAAGSVGGVAGAGGGGEA